MDKHSPRSITLKCIEKYRNILGIDKKYRINKVNIFEEYKILKEESIEEIIDYYYRNYYFRLFPEKVEYFKTTLIQNLYKINLEILQKKINKLSETKGEKEICNICLERNSDIITDCNHKSCKKCLFEWLKINKTCPMCRQLI